MGAYRDVMERHKGLAATSDTTAMGRQLLFACIGSLLGAAAGTGLTADVGTGTAFGSLLGLVVGVLMFHVTKRRPGPND